MRALPIASLTSLAAALIGFSLAGGVSAQAPVDAGVIPPTPASPDAGVVGDALVDAEPPPPPPPPSPPPPEPVAPPPVVIETAPPAPPPRDQRLARRDRHYVGAGLDVGVTGPLPDLGILGAYEPYRFVRVAAGFDYNLLGFGLKGDLTVINPYVVPVSLTGEFGTFFETDANSTVRKFVKKQKEDVASLKKVGYDYMNLLLGFEAGSQMTRFYVRVGTTFVRAKASDFEQTLKMNNINISRASDPKISYQGPTLKLGFFFFFP
jgi:hypothetical protein